MEDKTDSAHLKGEFREKNREKERCLDFRRKKKNAHLRDSK
jgi:hypothetical protein